MRAALARCYRYRTMNFCRQYAAAMQERRSYLATEQILVFQFRRSPRRRVTLLESFRRSEGQPAQTKTNLDFSPLASLLRHPVRCARSVIHFCQSIRRKCLAGADVSYLHRHFYILLRVHVHNIEKATGADAHAHVVYRKVARRNPAKAGKLYY